MTGLLPLIRVGARYCAPGAADWLARRRGRWTAATTVELVVRKGNAATRLSFSLSHSRQVMLKRCSERASSPSSLARCCCCCFSLSHGCRHRASARGQRRVRGEERRRANAVRLCELLPPLRLSPDSLAPSTAAAGAAGARCCCAAADAQLQPDRRRFTHDSSSSRSDRSRRSERSGGSSSSACPSPSGTRTPSLLPFDPRFRLL